MTDPTPNRPPLWWIMQGAYFEGRKPGHCDRLGYAAEIRAIADEIAARMRLLEKGYNLTAPEMISWLRDEADRAEAGDQ
jgi:hypothetical protein